MNDEQNEFLERVAEAAAVKVKTLSVKPSDVIHVQVGIGSYDMGDGQPPWIPERRELDYFATELEELIPVREGKKSHRRKARVWRPVVLERPESD